MHQWRAWQRRIGAAVAVSLLLAACRCGPVADEAAHACAHCHPFVTDAACPARIDPEAEDLDERLAAVFDGFDRAFDEGRYDVALACAQVAAREDPESPSAHLDRGLALDAIGAAEEALYAYTRALALDADDPHVLRAVADFHVRGPSRDGWEAALAFARRGRARVDSLELAAELASIEAEAANLLGRPAEALRAAESALILQADRTRAHLERAVALFELLRFEDAGRTLEALQVREEDNARVLWILGLVRERQGRDAEAAELLARAVRTDPDGYPSWLEVSAERFCKLVHEEARRLPQHDRERLAEAELRCEEIPAEEDLAAGEPVLSPTIVGLFRPGLPGERDTVVLYRRNLLRTVGRESELRREIRTTLLHEIGHLNGETDEELRDRGL